MIHKIYSIWLGVSNSHVPYSGTRQPINLIINDGGVDDIVVTFKSPPSRMAEAKVYDDELSRSFNINDLNPSSFRIGVQGSDVWKPNNVIVFYSSGMYGLPPDLVYAADLIPLALETNLAVPLSTDETKGKISQNIRRVNIGDNETLIKSMLLLILNWSHYENTGTKSPIKLEISIAGSLRVDWGIPRTHQSMQDKDGSGFYRIDGFSPFKRSQLTNESIVLRIGGNDKWSPLNIFLFGADEEFSRPTALVPLAQAKLFSSMSTDASEGDSFIRLPLCKNNY